MINDARTYSDVWELIIPEDSYIGERPDMGNAEERSIYKKQCLYLVFLELIPYRF